MAKLIVNPTSSSRREVSLGRTLVSIGRDPSNDVVLPDAMVSRRHAVIEYRGNRYYLRDCNSSNGSLVNGDRVTECGLRDGDLVAIGTARLLFREDPVVDASGKILLHPSAARQQCPSCHTDYRKGDSFCRQCGAGLEHQEPSTVMCAACGSAVLLPARFCSACGRGLGHDDEIPDGTRPQPRPEHDDVLDTGGENAERPGTLDMPPSALEPVAETAPVPRVDDDDGPAPNAPPAPASPDVGGPKPREAAQPRPPLRAPRPRPQAGEKAPAAPLVHRAAAALIDGVLVGVFSGALLTPAVLYWHSRDFLKENPSFVAILLTLALLPLVTAAVSTYFIYFWGVKGATLGKRLLGLRVETSDGVTPIGLGRATLRFLGYVVSTGFVGVGFLMGAFEGGALHDRIAATRVVRVTRE